MARQLSQILILLLLVLSPVSYSSAEIPDFSTETPPTASYQMRRAAAAIDGAPRQEKRVAVSARTTAVYPTPLLVLPPADSLNTPCAGRAPPQ